MSFNVFNAASVNGVPELDDWSSRDLSVADGSRILMNGVEYVFNSAIGEYLRWFVASTSCALDASISGVVIPSAEDPAWTHLPDPNTTNGSITSDGFEVRLNTESSNNDVAYCSYSHGQIGANHLMVGYCRVANVASGGASWQRIEVFDGQYQITLDPAGIGIAGSPIITRNTSSSPYAEVGLRKSITASSDVWFELYTDRRASPTVSRDGSVTSLGIAYVYLNHSSTPSLVATISSFASTSQRIYLIGDASNTHRASQYVRSIKCGRWAM